MNSREEVKIMEVKSIDLPIDGSRLGTSATGNVSSVYKYQDESERKAGTARVQDLSEDGRFLWTVEATLVIEQYGTKTTQVIQVRIPAKVEPVVPIGPVQFSMLTASVRLTKGQVYWGAEGIEPMATKPLRTSDHATP
jgi:hypothetical protein